MDTKLNNANDIEQQSLSWEPESARCVRKSVTNEMIIVCLGSSGARPQIDRWGLAPLDPRHTKEFCHTGRSKQPPTIRLLALVTALTLSATVLADDWPQWRGPNRDGISSETQLHLKSDGNEPLVAWRANVGTGFSSIVIADGRAFTMGNVDNTDTVFCLNAETGDPVWHHSYASPLNDKFFEGGPTSTPTVERDSLYTLGREGDLFCFDTATGDVKWQKNIAEEAEVRVPGWGFGGSPVVHGDLLLLAVGESGTAVNKNTGELIWNSADQDAGYATPLPLRQGDDELLLIASGKYYHLVELNTGKERWRYRWLTRFGCNAADPIVVGDTAFISSGYNRGSALLPLGTTEPEAVWKSKDFQNQFNSSVLIDGHLYGIDGDTTGERMLKCIEFATGEIKWSQAGFRSGALIAAGKTLIILSESGDLILAEANSTEFKQLSKANIINGKCWTAPALANGRLYCRSADGEVVCINLRR